MSTQPNSTTLTDVIAQAAIGGQPETKIAELCAELGITRQIRYRHVDAEGAPRPDGQKLLGPRTVEASSGVQ